MAELKVEQNEIGKLQINDLSYFFRKFFFLVMVALRICLFINQHLIR